MICQFFSRLPKRQQQNVDRIHTLSALSIISFLCVRQEVSGIWVCLDGPGAVHGWPEWQRGRGGLWATPVVPGHGVPAAFAAVFEPTRLVFRAPEIPELLLESLLAAARLPLPRLPRRLPRPLLLREPPHLRPRRRARLPLQTMRRHLRRQARPRRPPPPGSRRR